MHAVFVALALALVNPAFAGPVYEAEDVYEVAASHGSIAILPCDATVMDSRNARNRRSPEDLAADAEQYSTTFQSSMYAYFLRMKQRGKLPPELQDVEETNLILRRNGIESVEQLKEHTKAELAAMLGVDAVFSTTATTTVTFDKGGAVALSVLVGVEVNTGEADVFVKLHHGEDGRVIWSFDRKVAGGYATDPDDLVEYLMRRVSKRFPYKKL